MIELLTGEIINFDHVVAVVPHSTREFHVTMSTDAIWGISQETQCTLDHFKFEMNKHMERKYA